MGRFPALRVHHLSALCQESSALAMKADPLFFTVFYFRSALLGPAGGNLISMFAGWT
jgi:hypothetical protein